MEGVKVLPLSPSLYVVDILADEDGLLSPPDLDDADGLLVHSPAGRGAVVNPCRAPEPRVVRGGRGVG